MNKIMYEQEVLRQIHEEGETAYGLLLAADPNFEKRWNRLNTTMIKFLADVRTHFPDAEYYTSSGGFNLLLGKSHTDCGTPRQEFLALDGTAQVGDGDW